MERMYMAPPRKRLRRALVRAAFGCCVIVLAAAGFALRPASAQSGPSSLALEQRVKVAFLYKFLGYTEFPVNAFADAASPIVIGVVGADDMAAELARTVAGRSINNRPVAVRALRESELGTSLHLLFVAGSDCAKGARLVKAATGALLVVTECESGAPRGSVINFRIVDERVRFDVALDVAERNNVKLSSRLLTVANHVQKGAQP